MSKSFAEPASDDPFPIPLTTSAGTTNSPSDKRASCCPSILAGILSLKPSPAPSINLPGEKVSVSSVKLCVSLMGGKG